MPFLPVDQGKRKWASRTKIMIHLLPEVRRCYYYYYYYYYYY